MFVAAAPVHAPAGAPRGRLIDLEGERFYEIDGVDGMPPFLVSVASDRDHFLYVSSAGALTAGRRDPDHALFPYTTDDRIHDAAEHTGPRTLLRVRRGDGPWRAWEPWSIRHQGLYRTSRSLARGARGNQLRFEEVNHDLGLSFAYTWMTSARFGFVRRATLRELDGGGGPTQIELLDGVVGLLPAGIGRRFQMEYSTLADAYKESELDPDTGLGIFRLAAIPSDAAEPSEALRATTVWVTGLPSPTARLLCAAQMDRFRAGRPLEPEAHVRGRRGAYLVEAALALEPGAAHTWYLVADVDQDAAAVVATRRRLRATAPATLAAALDGDVARGTRNLVAIVARTDGLEATADELGGLRHFANVLFNDMRGGVPEAGAGYPVGRADLTRFIAGANRRVFDRRADFLAALPDTLPRPRLLAAARDLGDPDLERLVHEYLPLGFGRRHGDPSRPWNLFRVVLEDEGGRPVLDFQGNWRDLFQNWEALALSHPEYLESMIFRFADASTADGHNPYRLTRDGFEWEVLDPDDAWSHIGYWGDHQVVYLHRLLELSARHHPGALAGWLDRPVFTHAQVPYRIKPHDQQVADPKNTIEFDHPRHRATADRVAALGNEGKKLLDPAGDPCRVTLAEKLLVTALARLATHVPGAGLWLNTQRPEWNDANNALVGHGASVVTACHLRRFLEHARGLFAEGGAAFAVSVELAEAFGRMVDGLRRTEGLLARADVGDGDRRTMLDAVARPWSEYREAVYRHGLSGKTAAVLAREVRAFCALAMRHLDHTIAASRRDDGLYHAYNLVGIAEGAISIRRLPPMLEGQVSVLSSGRLGPAEALAVLDALRASPLWRPDRGSYLLYPDRRLPGFLEKNRLPAGAVAGSQFLTLALARGDRRIAVRDEDGEVHWNAALRNAAALARALDELRAAPDADPALAEAATAERAALLALYERVFDHRSFTGRSGSFFKYEGLGCIYWHMVSKLAVAVQEVLETAGREEGAAPAEVRERLRAHYREIRAGIGVHLSPEVYGAFPVDPYSHSPSFTGAQQPGMTGQVKEDIITRRGELGVTVAGGRLVFRRDLVQPGELLSRRTTFRYLDLDGREGEIDLGPGSLAFTICQVPVVAHRAGPTSVVVSASDGSAPRSQDGLALDAATSAAIFQRTGAIRRLDVFFALDG